MSYVVRCGAAVFSALVLLTLAGCGEENPNLQGTIVPTKTETVRNWLQGVAQRGQLDSGAEVMRKEIVGLKKEGVAKADAIAAKFDKLIKTRSPAAIRSQAQEMLKMLPPPQTEPRTETK